MNTNEIDVVIPWVDSTDYIWRKEKEKYSIKVEQNTVCDDKESRYRDWDTIKYLFRSIEMYMPWVRYVFFITYGHLPIWMNEKCENLKIINHKDFIPHKYLPTFSSHTIELNLHRIKDLSETFIYFNDDIIALKEMCKEDFFLDGLPRDYAILNPISCSKRLSVQDSALTDMEVINDHFEKKIQIHKHLKKWFTPCYGKYMIRTLCLLSWPHFVGFLSKHQGNAFLKSTFEEVWGKEYELLNSTCMHKFRTRRDVNQWIMRYWQLADGRFLPIKPYGGMYNICNDNNMLLKAIRHCKEKTICINDNNIEEIVDFEKTKMELIKALEERFPKKSQFEK